MKIFNFLFIFILLSSWGYSKEKKTDIPALLMEVEKKYSASKTFSAQFNQKQYVKAYDISKESSGLILIERPDKIRWEVKTPDASIMLTYGDKIKIYTPPFDEDDQGQLIIEKADKVHSRFVRDLLSGSFSLLKGVKNTKVSDDKFKLTPLNKKSIQGVTEAIVNINQKDHTIVSLVLKFVDGNQTEINFNSLEFGKVLEKDDFELRLPKKIDIIDRTLVKK